MVRSRFHSAGPETFAMVDGWIIDGQRMVAVDVAITHRGPIVILIWVMRRPGDGEVSDEPTYPARPKE
jgi:hypothetical protein